VPTKIKHKIKTGLLAGIVTSALLTAFYFFVDGEISWSRTITHFVLMTIIFGFLAKPKEKESKIN
jgi:TctA family transporter